MTRIFSGIRPSGSLHIGNYLGAVKNWVELQHKYESFFCIVDYHAITVPYEPADLRARTTDMALSLLAAGLDPSKCTLFVPVSYTHLRAHETRHDLVCRLLLEKKKKKKNQI